MKTTKTKKGFTLIELIVVIAIIGVLAAILIPAMLGYIKKSKITSINSAASQLYTAINGVLSDLEDEGAEATSIKSIDGSTKGQVSVSLEGVVDTEVYEALRDNMNGISKLQFKATCEGGACVAVACKSDNKYTGSKPAVVTKKNYTLYSDDLDKALADAESKAAAE